MDSSYIEIYSVDNGRSEISVRLENDTVWLNLNQLTELFQRDKSVISRHIKSIFKEKELDKISVVAKNATTASDGKVYQVEFYNLDVIISVGYRVKSLRGTQFRIWANRILRDYLVKGYAINELRVKQQVEQLRELQKSVKILGEIVEHKEISKSEGVALLQVISDYAYALDLLDQYDYQRLSVEKTSKTEIFRLTYEDAVAKIQMVRVRFGNSNLFGNEKDDSFKSSISTIYQTFEGVDLYPSIEEKAANLLYFVTKNHSFTDGNKRIAAMLFLYFLERNGALYRPDGTKRIADNALVALTLMIAISKPDEKETLIKVIVNLINKNN
jgi:prophage maintenance system killer protein